jgi:hypothetical protein
MFRNRIIDQVETPRLPVPPMPEASISGFTFCPLVCVPGVNIAQLMCQQAVYRWAYEQAQAVVRPSLPERDLLAVWN